MWKKNVELLAYLLDFIPFIEYLMVICMCAYLDPSQSFITLLDLFPYRSITSVFYCLYTCSIVL